MPAQDDRRRSPVVPLRTVGGQLVEVRRSARRRRTVSAYRQEDRIVVLMPQRTTRVDEERWVTELVGRIVAREQRDAVAGPRRSDAALLERARRLNRAYLAGTAEPSSVRWVPTMRTRWASCTPDERSIRVSERLRTMPGWVLDYVLVHELAHLLEPGHDARFWSHVARYPRTERARGYLDGVSAAASLGIDPELDGDLDGDNVADNDSDNVVDNVADDLVTGCAGGVELSAGSVDIFSGRVAEQDRQQPIGRALRGRRTGTAERPGGFQTGLF